MRSYMERTSRGPHVRASPEAATKRRNCVNLDWYVGRMDVSKHRMSVAKASWSWPACARRERCRKASSISPSSVFAHWSMGCFTAPPLLPFAAPPALHVPPLESEPVCVPVARVPPWLPPASPSRSSSNCSSSSMASAGSSSSSPGVERSSHRTSTSSAMRWSTAAASRRSRSGQSAACSAMRNMAAWKHVCRAAGIRGCGICRTTVGSSRCSDAGATADAPPSASSSAPCTRACSAGRGASSGGGGSCAAPPDCAANSAAAAFCAAAYSDGGTSCDTHESTTSGTHAPLAAHTAVANCT
mmetsp:Transcript_14152/g.59155  ORF Transcript_14152/g.59155 Transcript_14152/m.59155 type:complete len:300 (-) Transcript_14152:219-1118(-)